MSFNVRKNEQTIFELKVSDDQLSDIGKLHSTSSSLSCKIVAYAQITDENFSLLLLLTSDERFLVQYKIGSSSRFNTVSIKKLFPRKSYSQLALITISVDCSVIVCISSDGQMIYLVPFCAFMDVTLSRSTLLVSHPTTFPLFDFGSAFYESSRVSAANCFQSSSDNTYLLFGDTTGFLFIANLNLQSIDVKIDLTHGICSLHTFTRNGGKQLLVSLSDRSQMILPLEGSDISVRETLTRITSSQIHQIDRNLYIFPQLDGSVCVMDSSKNQLTLFDSLYSISLPSSQFCLDCFETGIVHQVICMPRMIVVMNCENDLFVHLHLSKSNDASVRYCPMKVVLPSEVSGKILHLIPSTNPTRNGEDALECFSIVTENGFFTLKTQKPLNDFVIAHLNSQFYSANCLSSVADSLQISSAKLCLSLLRHSLRNPSVFDISQIDGIISLTFKCKIGPNEILCVLRENNRAHLLLPFLRIKIEKYPDDDSLRQLLLGAIFGRIAQITEEEAKSGNQIELRKALEAEKDSLECELRDFLIKFDTDESEVLLLSLRHLLFSCVCVLLCRNAKMHSPTVVPFLLESPSLKSNKRIGNLLKCLSFIHWPSVDSFSTTIVANLLNFVPSFNIWQLKMVNRIATSLAESSIDTAQSLQLVCAMRLFHLSTQRNEPSNFVPKMHKNCVDSGPNCTTLIGEDVYGMLDGSGSSDRVDFRLFFWGEFSAGTQRLMKNRREKVNGNGEQCSSALVMGNAMPLMKKRGENSTAETLFEAVSTRKKRLNGRRGRPNPFALCSVPQAVTVSKSDLTFRAVACGTEHVLLLTIDGRLFSWGLNRYGQCGNGTYKPVFAPIEIKGSWGRIVSICAGHYHSGFITESDDIYLWGWGMHGQIGNGGIADLKRPSKSRRFIALGCVKQLCLGYSHTLALCTDGRVFGCGALSFGQLGVDPHNLEGFPMKAVNPIQLPFPMPISLIASKYFHGVALGMDHHKKHVLFEWGDSPQSLKMKTFLQKRLRLKQKKAKDNSVESNESSTAKREGEQIHFCIRKLCEWDEGPVKTLSAGFNHSALLTSDGQLFTWGKSLEMQLGHQNRKERSQPTKVEFYAAEGIRWSEVVCARNFTTAISAEGTVFVWGRNDKFQLGLGKTSKKGTCQIRTITLKSDKGNTQRNVELPADNCVETPTILHRLRAFVENAEQTAPDEKQLSKMLADANQLSLDTLSRFLAKHPFPNFTAVQVHLMSGDLLAALRLLVFLVEEEGLLSESMSPSNWSERPVTVLSQANASKVVSPSAKDYGNGILKNSSTKQCPSKESFSLNSSESKRLVAVKLTSTFCSSSSSGCLPTHRLELFHTFVDKIWALLRVHPSREVQTCALIELLYHGFPIYNRLAMDLCLCRLVCPFLTIPSPTESTISPLNCSSTPSSSVRLNEFGFRERAVRLRQAKVSDLNGANFRALKNRCEKLLAQFKWRFFFVCGHFEKCVTESGPNSNNRSAELADKRNKWRQCAKCVEREGRAKERRDQ